MEDDRPLSSGNGKAVLSVLFATVATFSQIVEDKDKQQQQHKPEIL